MPALKTPANAAFTLLEVMIALTVMAVGIFAVFSSIGTTVNMVKVVGDHELVSQAMENRIEEIQAAQWAPPHTDTPLFYPSLPRTFMDPIEVMGVQPLRGRDDVIVTEFARWDNALNAYVPLQDPRSAADWNLLSEDEKEMEWAKIVPDDFDILLITMRADWLTATGPITTSMEFVLVDRDGI